MDHCWSWTEKNPGWDYRFWNDQGSRQFVNRWYPQYSRTFRRLIPIQRADFLRYLLLHHHGGLYADLDTTCLRPIGELLRPEDEFVCCVEGVVPDEETRRRVKFARLLQLSSGTFLSAPGHPILEDLCVHIHANRARRFHDDFILDTLDKTGNGAFTDAVLAHRASHRVRVLPTYVFVAGSMGTDGFDTDYPDFVEPLAISESEPIFVQHHFAGLWKNRGSPLLRKLRRFAGSRIRRDKGFGAD